MMLVLGLSHLCHVIIKKIGRKIVGAKRIVFNASLIILRLAIGIVLTLIWHDRQRQILVGLVQVAESIHAALIHVDVADRRVILHGVVARRALTSVGIINAMPHVLSPCRQANLHPALPQDLLQNNPQNIPQNIPRHIQRTSPVVLLPFILHRQHFIQNQYGKPNSEERMIQYICMFPDNHPKNTKAMKKKRLKYFNERRTTSHSINFLIKKALPYPRKRVANADIWR